MSGLFTVKSCIPARRISVDPRPQLAPPLRRKLKEVEDNVIQLIHGHELERIEGDAMVPTLPPGAEVLVDRYQTMPNPPGIFMVQTPIGEKVCRCSVVPNTKPLRVSVTYDNERYPSYEVASVDVQIAGRVIGVFTRL
jgi:phage repressor protein C with HTH and peptisase S24 domain